MSIEPERLRALAGLRERIRALGVADYEVWLAYLRCGGSGDLLSFQAYLYGALDLAATDWTCLTHSVWEVENL